MPERAVLPRQQPVGINCDGNDFFLGVGEIRRSQQHLMILPGLNGGTEGLAMQDPIAVQQDLQNGRPANQNGPANHNGLANLNGLAHVVPGRPPYEEEQLQQVEQADLNAVRTVVNLPIHNNVISASHFWMALTTLAAMLPREGPCRIPHFQVEFARILERMARVMVVPSKEMYESAHCQHRSGLDYDDVLQRLQEMAPECPFGYSECLHRLAEQVTAGASMMHGADGVFIINHRDEFANHLRSLAKRLLRSV